VRALDPHIHIVLYTHLPDVDGSELVAVVGGSTHFFRMPFREGEELQFCGKVRELIDDWNSGL
jgi:hypothetical protein